MIPLKRVTTFLIILNVTLSLFAQTNNFAPIGATWYYDDYLNECPTFPDCGYYKMESVGDTLIVGKNCRVLNETYFVPYYDIPDTQYIIYEDLGIVYLYDEGAFHELYNFNADAGDTITTFPEAFNGYYGFIDYTFNEFRYIIDSVVTELIDGELLRIQYTRALEDVDGWGFWEGPMIIEKIGSIGMFLGIPNIIYPEYGGFLRCYSDDEFEYQYIGFEHACDFITSIKNEIPKSFEIFPNPASDNLTINSSFTEKIDPVIINILGEVCEYKFISQESFTSKIDISELPEGIYFLSLEDEKNPAIKFVKI